MHPAYSVIFFTTASGLGYGLLFVLSVYAAFGLLPQDVRFGFAGLGIAVTLIVSGLLSSTFHLGHPERAWRALSQVVLAVPRRRRSGRDVRPARGVRGGLAAVRTHHRMVEPGRTGRRRR
jgi:hypothetical protein